MKKIWALILTITLSFSLAACGSKDAGSTADQDTFVTINGISYSENDFDEFFNLYASLNQLENSAENKEYFLNNGLKDIFAFQMLVMQEAEKEGVDISLKEADDILTKDASAAYGSKENYQKQFLDPSNISWDDMVWYYQIALDYEALLDKRISESDVDLEAVYNADPGKYCSAEQVSARHILVETEDEAKDIIAQLDNGADFATLAEEYSIDPGSAAQGGSLGYFTKDQMVTEFSDAAFSTPVGQYTETPVKSQFGYHIILVEDHTQPKQLSFEEAEDYVRADVESDISETFSNDLMNNAEIVYPE